MQGILGGDYFMGTSGESHWRGPVWDPLKGTPFKVFELELTQRGQLRSETLEEPAGQYPYWRRPKRYPWGYFSEGPLAGE